MFIMKAKFDLSELEEIYDLSTPMRIIIAGVTESGKSLLRNQLYGLIPYPYDSEDFEDELRSTENVKLVFDEFVNGHPRIATIHIDDKLPIESVLTRLSALGGHSEDYYRENIDYLIRVEKYISNNKVKRRISEIVQLNPEVIPV